MATQSLPRSGYTPEPGQRSRTAAECHPGSRSKNLIRRRRYTRSCCLRCKCVLRRLTRCFCENPSGQGCTMLTQSMLTQSAACGFAATPRCDPGLRNITPLAEGDCGQLLPTHSALAREQEWLVGNSPSRHHSDDSSGDRRPGLRAPGRCDRTQLTPVDSITPQSPVQIPSPQLEPRSSETTRPRGFVLCLAK